MVEGNRQELQVPEPDPQPTGVLELEAPNGLTVDGNVDHDLQERAAVADLLDVLRRLGELHASGFLIDVEFEAKKASILERL